ncbi:MAG: sulfoxide reductase heme-binding subunit YedZ [Caldilineales bacterium]|nr:sulfoxide reductase heme-binding subunit YedZ [Caldilineales bacterium]
MSLARSTRLHKPVRLGPLRLTPFQIGVHLAALGPLLLLVSDLLGGRLSVNPIQDLTFRTGKTAMVLLLLSLACTPAATWLGFRPALKVRRALGLYAFVYAALHFFIYLGVDYGFDLHLVGLELAEKRYVLVGFAAFLLLVPLAITSTQGWQRRLGRRWKRLHKAVYPAAVLVMFHYIWVQKADIRQPLAFSAVLLLLFILRLPALRRWAAAHPFRSWRRREARTPLRKEP